MKKKGIIALALTAALALGALTGCGNTTAKETTGSTDAAAETTKASETVGSEAAGSETAVSGETRVVKLGLTGVIYEDIWNPIKEELAKVPEQCGELDAVIQVAVGCESKKYWNPIGTYRVVIDGTEYMVELEEETERFR